MINQCIEYTDSITKDFFISSQSIGEQDKKKDRDIQLYFAPADFTVASIKLWQAKGDDKRDTSPHHYINIVLRHRKKY